MCTWIPIHDKNGKVIGQHHVEDNESYDNEWKRIDDIASEVFEIPKPFPQPAVSERAPEKRKKEREEQPRV